MSDVEESEFSFVLLWSWISQREPGDQVVADKQHEVKCTVTSSLILEKGMSFITQAITCTKTYSQIHCYLDKNHIEVVEKVQRSRALTRP